MPQPTDEQRRAWMAQWRGAAVALTDQRARELGELTDAEALAASDALLSLALVVGSGPEAFQECLQRFGGAVHDLGLGHPDLEVALARALVADALE